jgi:hypothetical protein
MSTSFSLPQHNAVVEALNPATDAAGRTGKYVSFKNVVKGWLVCQVTQGNAATVALSLSQATAVAGTSAKATTAAVPIWSNLDTAASNAPPTARTAAASYTTDAGVKNKVVILEVDPAQVFDLANGFDCLAPVTGASNVANITSAVWHLQMKDKGEPPVNPSAD